MKRLIALAALICLLLCGCGSTGATPPDTAPQTPSTDSGTENTPSTPAAPDGNTESVPSKPEKVTVYLLTEMTVFDSGSTKYNYDENHNIDSYQVFTIENTPMYNVFFEQKDADGMACVVRTQWPEGIGNGAASLTYLAGGKLEEEQTDGSSYSGYQYAYDGQGNLTEKREYYDGILQSTVYYEYDGELLTAAYCTDNADNKVFECRIENGLVTEKVFFDPDVAYGYRYKYDENRNLTETEFYFNGETTPGDQYFYTAVEVDAERAPYLQEQQKYLIHIT